MVFTLNSQFIIYDLPKDTNKGRALDLIINKDLNIPYHSHPYVFGCENKK